MKEDYQAVLDYAGHGKKVVGFPATPAIWGLRLLDRLKLSPLYKWVYETASKDSFVSIEKAQRELGYQAEVLQQGRSSSELPVVYREPGAVRERLRRLAPGAVETGRYRPAQAFLLAVRYLSRRSCTRKCAHRYTKLCIFNVISPRKSSGMIRERFFPVEWGISGSAQLLRFVALRLLSRHEARPATP